MATCGFDDEDVGLDADHYERLIGALVELEELYERDFHDVDRMKQIAVNQCVADCQMYHDGLQTEGSDTYAPDEHEDDFLTAVASSHGCDSFDALDKKYDIASYLHTARICLVRRI